MAVHRGRDRLLPRRRGDRGGARVAVRAPRRVHPGYGFLSENAPSSRARARRPGSTWIGPPPEAIELMGDKLRAKEAAAAARACRWCPGLHRGRGPRQGLGPTRRRLPVLVKAAAGGGGKGMRVVRIARGARGRAGLGPPRGARRVRRRPLLVERFLPRRATSRSRCSPTRTARRAPRRARVLAAAPPPEGGRGGARRPSLDATLRAPLGGEAVALARAARLRRRRHGRVRRRRRRPGRALLPRDEHPPAGRAPRHRARHRRRPRRAGSCASPPASRSPSPGRRPSRGHAIEARVYAEDPAHGFLPAAGSVLAYARPREPRRARRRRRSRRARWSARATTRCSPR